MKFSIENHKKENRDKAINNAISNWTDKKNGVYKWFEKERYSTAYCKEQIEYFKNLKIY